MKYAIVYLSIALTWIILVISAGKKGRKTGYVIIGLVSAVYSLSFDTFFGEYTGLYHYLNTEISPVYIIITGILLYPVLNVIYSVFIPHKTSKLIVYTLLWITAMILFEQLTLITDTVVLTGWEPLPWSIVVYIATYALILTVYGVLSKKNLI